ncbi:MAG TPA: TIM barrel protein, partial [Ramlibacter sp.]
MPKFAANLSMLFTEFAFLDRFEHAARAGFSAVEFLFPYEHEPHEIRSRLDRHGLQLVLHNLPAGDWAAGDRGIACHPAMIGEFREGVAAAVRYAKALGVCQLNCLCGKAPAGVARGELRATLVANLRYAADRFEDEGLRLLVEPINTFDIPGFVASTTDEALALI